MHRASASVEICKKVVEKQIIAMDEAKTRHSDLLVPVKRRRATSAQFAAFKTAKKDLRERERLLDESKARLQTAKSDYLALCQKFVQAKFHCGSLGCPWSHGIRQEIIQELPCFGRQEMPWGVLQEAPWTNGNGQERTSGENTTWPQPTTQSTATAKPTAPTRATASPSTYEEWILIAQEAFRNYAALSSFPSPPANVCSNPTCMSATKDATRALKACACKIRQGLHYQSISQLKSLRLLFHPDKFSKCRADRVERFKKQASEVFVVVEALYREKSELVIADEDVEMTDCDF
jgi:hypothetical protein